MAGRIPTQFINDLLTRVDIVNVIDSRVPLKKMGREYKACCPFHSEKTPSFTVSSSKQFYHCFGCGAHGSAIGFLMEYEHLDFIDAVEELAASVGVTVPRENVESKSSPNRNASIYDILEQAHQYYRRQLREHSNASQAIDYLKRRGLTGDIAAQYGVGYAPPGWDNLHRLFAGYDEKQLLETGLLTSKDETRYYDRFRNRIMFPIRDRRGRVIGFGGRAIGTESPKYLNSPETGIFHKGSELYGLYEARKENRHLEYLLVVEGYMDVIALSQFNIKNVVATLGTATTKDHLEKLFRIVSDVVFCFDGDRAGRQAAWRAVEQVLPVMSEGRQVRFMFLPEGEDPDSLVRKEGEQGFKARISESTPFSNFFFDALSKGKSKLNVIEESSVLVEKARPLLMQIPEGVFRYKMIERLAEEIQMDAQKLSTLIFSAQHPTISKQRPRIPPGKGDFGTHPVRKAIRMLLEVPQLAIPVDPHRFDSLALPGIPLFLSIIDFVHKNPQISCAAILEHWRGSDEGTILAKVIQIPLDVPDEGMQAEFEDVLNWLAKQHDEQRFKELHRKSMQGPLSEAEKREINTILGR